MFRAFQLQITEQPDPTLVEIGRSIFQEDYRRVGSHLKEYLAPGGAIDAEKVKAAWFTEVTADIFISHSHDDEEKALHLAGFLKTTFGLQAFVDSSIWKNSHNLQKLIDDEHSWSNHERTLYDYTAVQGSTTHVNMMLATSISKMIDSSECVFFLRTDRSLTSAQSVNPKTASSWIYYEIEAIRSLRIRSSDEHRQHTKIAKMENFSTRKLKVEYPLNFERFSELDDRTRHAWKSECKGTWGQEALDTLYRLIPNGQDVKLLNS